MEQLTNILSIFRHSYKATATAVTALYISTGALAAAGTPLPRCDASTASFYLMRYSSPAAVGTPPTTNLSLATVPATGAVALSQIWNAAAAPTVSPREIPLAPATAPLPAGASVAGGMGNDGYIYAIRAVDGDNNWDTSPAAGWGSGQGGGWRTHTRNYELFRYGRDGVDNLGIVDGLGPYLTSTDPSGTSVPGALDARLGPNFNAADVDPVTGILYVASFQTGGSLNRVFRVDVTQTPPKVVSTLTLTANIPGTQSGDFAIDAAGQWAYGVAITSSVFAQNYRFNLSSGAVEFLGGPYNSLSFGGAARLPNDATKLAFFGTSTRIMTIPAGTLGSSQATATANGGDAASCLPKFVATLQCTPTDLVDSAGQVANCTVTINQPAPLGGLSIALTPPPANSRYTTTCGSAISVAAGETSASCSITATANTVPADGDVSATLQLATPDAMADYVLGTPIAATVTVRNDDLPSVGVSCTPNSLVDADSQVAVCTITSNVPAPVGGMTIRLTSPISGPRFSTTCGNSAVIEAGASSTTCTITATPNTVVGDGDVTVSLALATPATGAGYQLGTPNQASILVRDDDVALPPPLVNVACTPSSLVDSADQVSTCIITLSAPAPAGGLNVAITAPAANSRYSTTCASPLAVAARASTASCTITATPNTVAGDGSVTALLQLQPGTGYGLGAKVQDTVSVNDDDQFAVATPVPSLGQWALAVLSLILGGLAAVGLRRSPLR